MQWWCSADGTAWTWKWQAFPGIWLITLIMALGYYYMTRGAQDAGEGKSRGVIAGWAGVVCIWIALDWPLGPLAAGYLASAHSVQFLLIAFIAVPLILFGIRSGGVKRVPAHGAAGRIVRILTFPVTAALIFNIIIIATHTATVVDTLMVTQWGAFLNDLLWFVGAMLFWWPVIVPVPERPHFNGVVQVVYIFLGTIFHTIIGIVLLISRYPLYGIYELAPPMSNMSALRDLHIAGGIMELAGSAIVFPLMSYIFFKWVRRSQQDSDRKDDELAKEWKEKLQNTHIQGVAIDTPTGAYLSRHDTTN